MLKVYDKAGNLRYVFKDEDRMPVEAVKYAKELLEKYNIKVIDTDDDERKTTLEGISQDDLKHLKEENK